MEMSRTISKYIYADDTEYYGDTSKNQDIRILTTSISSNQALIVKLGKKIRF